MGLSSKQVSRDGLGWSQTLSQAQTLELSKPASMMRSLSQAQNHQQQSEPLKCPRCDSTNTKFCYYNNYNKSQPRHFCKTCKRHWTKGGTLRNVPVGGGRKNKRHKTSNNSASFTTSPATATTGNNNSRVDTHMAVQCQQPRQNHPITLGDQKNLSDVLYQGLIHPPTSLLQQNPSNLDIKDMSTNNVSFISSIPLLPQNQSLHLPNYADTSSFDTKPLSILTSFQSSNVFNYTGESIEDPSNIINLSSPKTSSNTLIQPWQIPPATSSGMDMTSYWNWDDIDTFVSTDLNIPWVDPDVKP